MITIKGELLLKKQFKIFIIFIIVISTLILLLYVFELQNILFKRVYPKYYSEYVQKYAEEYNIDPLLVYSVIKAESNFNPNAISTSGAMGLMQVMELTAIEKAEILDINMNSDNINKLFEPSINIHIGVSYLAFLLEKYNGNIMLALAAYNAGLGNVNRWIEEGIIKPDGSNIGNIPFRETNSYVRRILRNYELYKRLYLR
jgi:soluble lytic murein transglycosylase